jgi:hypothetical protein
MVSIPNESERWIVSEQNNGSPVADADSYPFPVSTGHPVRRIRGVPVETVCELQACQVQLSVSHDNRTFLSLTVSSLYCCRIASIQQSADRSVIV